MTDDRWPDGMLPVRPKLRKPASFGKSAIVNVDGQELLHVPVQRDDAPLDGFIERACRAVNSFDELVLACEAAHSWIIDGGMDNAIAAQLGSALAKARKQEG